MQSALLSSPEWPLSSSHAVEEVFHSQHVDCTIRYARFSSSHYTIPNPLSIDLFFFVNEMMHRFISLIREMPNRKQASVKTVLLAHNVDGLLFHLPLFHLLFHHLREDSDSFADSSLFDGNESDPSDDKLTFSRLMSLNVIVDLSRLLTHGYSHLYTVYGFVHESLHPLVTLEPGSTAASPMTYWESLCQKYATYQLHPSADETSENSVYYHSYLQSLQKFVYLMVIDDYLSVMFALPFSSTERRGYCCTAVLSVAGTTSGDPSDSQLLEFF